MNVVFAGIIRHGSEISAHSLNFVLEATCVNKIRAHILGSDDMTTLAEIYERQKELMFPGKQCALLKVSSQPSSVSKEKKRIERMQSVRDFQRKELSEHFYFDGLDKATIILADMDVSELPPVDQVVSNAIKMNRREGMNVDVLCSSGKMLDPYGYYDIFATILLPDTFVYPVNGRPVMVARPEEDASLIINNNNNFTAPALLEWFHRKGGAAANPVPVKSCFGGLAIYRASKWLDDRCSYRDNDPELNAKYFNKYDDAPCEHVVFHNCLRSVDPTVVLAVKPDMHTVWHAVSVPEPRFGFPDLATVFRFEYLFSVVFVTLLLRRNAFFRHRRNRKGIL